MPQNWVEVEENRNCPYSSLQVFETLGEVRAAREVRLAVTAGTDTLQVIGGWSSAEGGRPCPVRYVEVSDSGGGASLLTLGFDRPTPPDLGTWQTRRSGERHTCCWIPERW